MGSRHSRQIALSGFSRFLIDAMVCIQTSSLLFVMYAIGARASLVAQQEVGSGSSDMPIARHSCLLQTSQSRINASSSCCHKCSKSPYCSPKSWNCYTWKRQKYYSACAGGDSGSGSEGEVSVLSYNLFWWNLFGRRHGNGKSAGKLIASNGPYDIMGFQECEDVGRVLADAGLEDSHESLPGGHALAIAYRRSSWERLGSDSVVVGEDRHDQYYGKRVVNWARLRHLRTRKVVFFVNHHGPLPVNSGGKYGGDATAHKILRVLNEHAHKSDLQIIVGDFNADTNSATQRVLKQHMKRVHSHWVDAIFASRSGLRVKTLGKGGSDHDAIEATFRF